MLDADRYFFYAWAWLTAADRLGLTRLLSRSKFGYGLVAIRENEEAAEVMGINTTLHQGRAPTCSAPRWRRSAAR